MIRDARRLSALTGTSTLASRSVSEAAAETQTGKCCMRAMRRQSSHIRKVQI